MTGDSRNSLVLGITGGVACGKSEVGRILGEMGFEVCGGDRVAHDLMKKGTPVYRQVVDRFGMRILSDDGEISRPILGKAVFANPTEREVLNGLVHPAVRENLEWWVLDIWRQQKKAAILVPLLFESGMETLPWDAIICVSSSKELVFQRLEKRGLDQNEAVLRVESQMPLAEKERRSDYVVSNVGTLGELDQSSRNTVKRVMAER